MSTQQKFFTWAAGLEEQRLPLLAGMLTVHGCITVPVTMGLLLASGAGLFLLGVMVFTTFAVLVTNLAALPTKITVPTYVFVTAIHLALIAISISKLLIA